MRKDENLEGTTAVYLAMRIRILVRQRKFYKIRLNIKKCTINK